MSKGVEYFLPYSSSLITYSPQNSQCRKWLGLESWGCLSIDIQGTPLLGDHALGVPGKQFRKPKKNTMCTELFKIQWEKQQGLICEHQTSQSIWQPGLLNTKTHMALNLLLNILYQHSLNLPKDIVKELCFPTQKYKSRLLAIITISN